MGTKTRELTLEEEIKLLDISEEAEGRLLLKLSNIRSEFDESLFEMEKKATSEREKYDKMREQNISLKSACFALAAALKQEYEL